MKTFEILYQIGGIREWDTVAARNMDALLDYFNEKIGKPKGAKLIKVDEVKSK